MANIWVTGANGQLGSELKRKGFTDLDEVFYTDIAEVDITDPKAVSGYVRLHEIDTIINCAAYTAVDCAEEEPERAAAVNTEAVANLAKTAAEEDCLLIHISTDYVFDGTAQEPYDEKSGTNPQSVYGKTKLAGEKAIKNSYCLAIIIRTAWLYSEYGNNFVKTMLRLAKEKGELKVVADQFGTPTYAADLADAIIRIAGDENVADKTGIYHFSDEGVCSWYDFAVEIVRQSGIDCRVQPLTTEQYPTKARRPAYSVLDKTKIKREFEVVVPDWKESLGKCLDRMKE